MGCDIHMFIEKTTNGGLFWELDQDMHKVNIDEKNNEINITSPHPGRNYEIFGLMAGVRSFTSLYPPRGIPQNCSLPISVFWEVEEEKWCHTPSYLSTKEFIDCLTKAEVVLYSPSDDPKDGEEVNVSTDEYKFTSFTEFARRMRYLEKANPNEQVRLVFWFDS